MHPALRLYRAILKQHRIKLPLHLRQLGDNYVREEFRRHKTAKPEFLNEFFSEWTKYLVMLRQQQGQFGAYLSEHEVRSLNQEQLDQLQKLRQEAEKAFGPEEATFPKLG